MSTGVCVPGVHRVEDAVEIETGPNPVAAVIWLHGLGADGHDFEPIVPELVRPGERALRFIFPHAPVRPVTLNGGYAMRAWYDIAALDRRTAEDERGIRESQATIEACSRETARHSQAHRARRFFTRRRHGVVRGTLSGRLAGIMGLSCYLVLARA
jgi:phospholipase/carboxylesterase